MPMPLMPLDQVLPRPLLSPQGLRLLSLHPPWSLPPLRPPHPPLHSRPPRYLPLLSGDNSNPVNHLPGTLPLQSLTMLKSQLLLSSLCLRDDTISLDGSPQVPGLLPIPTCSESSRGMICLVYLALLRLLRPRAQVPLEPKRPEQRTTRSRLRRYLEELLRGSLLVS